MKWLIIISLLFCSCKTKEVAREVKSDERFSSDISILNEKAKVDTTKTKKIEQIDEYIRITEEIIITEYDTEKQAVSKITEKKKISESGKKTQTDESEERGMTSVQKDSIDHSLDSTKKEDTKEEVKEESVIKGFFDKFGKWMGIGICVILFIWLLRKYVHNRLTSQS